MTLQPAGASDVPRRSRLRQGCGGYDGAKMAGYLLLRVRRAAVSDMPDAARTAG